MASSSNGLGASVTSERDCCASLEPYRTEEEGQSADSASLDVPSHGSRKLLKVALVITRLCAHFVHPPSVAGQVAMSNTQEQKAVHFRSLHQKEGAFVMPNPFDAGSAKCLESLGFEAIATSSGASAATLAQLDGSLRREQAMEHASLLVTAVNLPVSADLEDGFGSSPKIVQETIVLAAETGLVGCSIDDARRGADVPVYEIAEASDRIAAASEAAKKLGFPFMLTARAENLIKGRNDLEDTIRRLQAYERAGADVLMAPGLPTLDAVRQVCAALSRPYNFMVGIPGKSFSCAELAAAGVRRISLATSLYRAAMGQFVAAAREVRKQGTFGYQDSALPSAELTRYLSA